MKMDFMVGIKGLIKRITHHLYKNRLKEESIRDMGVNLKGKINFDILPYIAMYPGSQIQIEDGVSLISDPKTNPSGILHPCTLVTQSPNACIYLGKDSGMSGATLCCKKKIRIGEYVGLGANVSVFDHDFHPLNPYYRKFFNEEHTLCKEVIIEDFAWIGANSIILKGVHIGRGAVVGAGSVVTCDIPPLTVYAGNPARFIKKVEIEEDQYRAIFSD